MECHLQTTITAIESNPRPSSDEKEKSRDCEYSITVPPLSPGLTEPRVHAIRHMIHTITSTEMALIHRPASCQSWWGRWRTPGRPTGDAGSPSWRRRPRSYRTGGSPSPRPRRPMGRWCRPGRRAGSSSRRRRSPGRENSSTSTAGGRAIEALCFLETRSWRCSVASPWMDRMRCPGLRGTGYCSAFFLALLIWGSWTCMTPVQLQDCRLKRVGWFVWLQNGDLIGSSRTWRRRMVSGCRTWRTLSPGSPI